MTTDVMRCSVIIPTFNRVHLIPYTLDSLLPEHHPDVALEIIVVDDGSTDGTAEMIHSRYAHVIFLKNPKKGAGAARNFGLAKVSTEYVMFLDSDDLAGDNYFADKLKYLAEHPGADACYGNYEFFSGGGAFNTDLIIFKHKYPKINFLHSAETHLRHYLGGTYLPAPCVIYRKSFLQKTKGYDESLPINQDVDLIFRSVFEGLQLDYVHSATYIFIRDHHTDNRVGDTGKSSARLMTILELRKKVYQQLCLRNWDSKENRLTLSHFLFNFWRSTRHFDKATANAFLSFAKEVYWPIVVRGGFIYSFLSRIVGPVAAVEIKYALLKHD
jgi:glycosyltransferase involved in cell wall biosynthesis